MGKQGLAVRRLLQSVPLGAMFASEAIPEFA